MENLQSKNCIFCFSLLFSNIKIEYTDHPYITTNCFLGHKKEIDFSLFFDFNNRSYDNLKLKVECPLCKELLDKDVFFICLETNQIICPKCIALNIVLTSKDKKKKSKKNNTKKNQKTQKTQSLPQPHYSTLVSLLKESNQKNLENINNDFLNEKNIEDNKKVILSKYIKYKEIIINEKEQKYLNIIYNFINNLNNLQKKASDVYKENKNYISNYFYENIKNISFYNDIQDIFKNNFSKNNIKLSFSKELNNSINLLNNFYKDKTQNNLFINKLLDISNNKNRINNNKDIFNCIYQQESIISHILYFTYELEHNKNEKENFLIISSNNGIINILDTINYKQVYILDIFQKKGVYHLIQSKKEKNIFYASSWGCFKKIQLIIEISKDSNIPIFKHTILKTYKKSDIIRILKLIEIPKKIISLDEGGHIIAWGLNETNKKETKEEIFVDREDSINNIIFFQSNKLRDMLIFSTRNSTLLGKIFFYNIEDGFYELKCIKNKFKSKQISFDLQYNSLTQINDYMIVFPQNKKLIFIDVKSYQLTTIIEMEIDLIKDKFYNAYGETIGILNFFDHKNKCFLVLSSKGYFMQYLVLDENNENEILFMGIFKSDELKEEAESMINSLNNKYEVDLNNKKLYIKLNKKILVLDINQNK